jgi:hypothetical protein
MGIKFGILDDSRKVKAVHAEYEARKLLNERFIAVLGVRRASTCENMPKTLSELHKAELKSLWQEAPSNQAPTSLPKEPSQSPRKNFETSTIVEALTDPGSLLVLSRSDLRKVGIVPQQASNEITMNGADYAHENGILFISGSKLKRKASA